MRAGLTSHRALHRAHHAVRTLLRKEAGDHKFSILLPSHKLYLCLWESIVYNPL